MANPTFLQERHAKLRLRICYCTTLCHKSKQCTTQNLRQDRDKLLTRAPTRHRSTPKPRFKLGAQMVATFILGVVGRHDVGSGAVNYYGCAAGAPVWLQRPPYDISSRNHVSTKPGKRVYKINFASLFAAPYRMLQT